MLVTYSPDINIFIKHRALQIAVLPEVGRHMTAFDGGTMRACARVCV
jgi:hypothetical protein